MGGAGGGGGWGGGGIFSLTNYIAAYEETIRPSLRFSFFCEFFVSKDNLYSPNLGIINVKKKKKKKKKKKNIKTIF